MTKLDWKPGLTEGSEYLAGDDGRVWAVIAPEAIEYHSADYSRKPIYVGVTLIGCWSGNQLAIPFTDRLGAKLHAEVCARIVERNEHEERLYGTCMAGGMRQWLVAVCAQGILSAAGPDMIPQAVVVHYSAKCADALLDWIRLMREAETL